MRRRLFNLAAAVSLAMCAATSVLWPRSMRTRDVWGVRLSDGRAFGIISDGGSISLVWMGNWRPVPSEILWFHGPGIGGAAHFGFGWSRSGPQSVLSVPHALPLLTTAGFSYWAFRHARRSARLPGTCARCGYDLRASPERCPECGTAVTRPARGSEAV